MKRMEYHYDQSLLSVAHVHLVYTGMLTEIENMCDIFNLGVADRGEKHLYYLIKEAINEVPDDKESRLSPGADAEESEGTEAENVIQNGKASHLVKVNC